MKHCERESHRVSARSGGAKSKHNVWKKKADTIAVIATSFYSY